MFNISDLLTYVLVFLFILAFFVTRFGYIACDSTVCLVGKTALVTGGSRGLGYEIVVALASRGCRVIVAGKTVDENVRKRIIDATDNTNIVLEHVDFASFKSVRQLAEKLNKSEEKLDILINNSGIGKSLDGVVTEDGLKMTMQVNHYSPFLLTHLIADLLKKSKNGRIVFTSSYMAFVHMMIADDVTPTNIKDASPIFRIFDYSNSKFCNIVSSDLFAEKLKSWNVTCNSYNPLVAKTDIFEQTNKNINYWNPLEVVINFGLQLMIRIFGISPKLTCQAGIKLAVAKEYKNVTGKFVGKVVPDWKPRGAHDRKFCEAIWNASEHIVKLTEEEKLR